LGLLLRINGKRIVGLTQCIMVRSFVLGGAGSCRSDGVLLRADKPATVLDSAWSRTFGKHQEEPFSAGNHEGSYGSSSDDALGEAGAAGRQQSNASVHAPPCCALQCACAGSTCPAGCPNCCSPRALENAWGSYSQVGALRWSYFLGVDLQAPFPLTAMDFDPLPPPLPPTPPTKNGQQVAAGPMAGGDSAGGRYDRGGEEAAGGGGGGGGGGAAAAREWVAFEYWHGLARYELTLLNRSSTYPLPRCNSSKQARILGENSCY
jgi:hypothetical protein